MAETRAQQMLKEAVVRETSEALGSRIIRMEETIADQNTKIDRSVADIFEAIQAISEKTERAITSIERSQRDPNQVVHDNGINHPRSSRSGTNTHYTGMTRLGRLDFPRFNGDKVREWLFKVEEFFLIDGTPEDLKVRISSIHFDAPASTWHQAIMQSDINTELLMEWKSYRLLLLERFEEVLDDPIAELKHPQKRMVSRSIMRNLKSSGE
ncbi:hypothetical protein Bca52824_066379 [Brassica carinata]|uniref:Retrotransposon gag domain-containing protein n=1 Tax=Brassica carinata TaxID=52824 RepID=A0A8X7QR30_BRACI|nr:hypothetical protein Bca52824_066379 [Brassica carinata]